MRDHFPYGYTFLAGVIAGILFLNFGKSILLENTGFLDRDTLCQVRSVTVESSALFALVLRKRVGSLLVLAVLATTYLGLAACVAAAFGCGFCLGVFLCAAVLRFGVKGFFLVLSVMCPQYLIYLPVFYLLCLWCEGMYKRIYQKKTYTQQTETPAIHRRVLQFGLILAAVLFGCMLESFANPTLLFGFLKSF